MVKVTGGGKRVGAVVAHFNYISRKGELSIETDEGALVANREAQKALVTPPAPGHLWEKSANPPRCGNARGACAPWTC